jgi:hypothetical protein
MPATQHSIELAMGGYGKATFNLKIVTQVDNSIAPPPQPIKLLENATANGNGESIPWMGGGGTVTVVGHFHGAKVTLKFSPDNTNWFDFAPDEIKFDAPAAAQFDNLGARQYIRAVVSDADASGNTSVTCFLASF